MKIHQIKPQLKKIAREFDLSFNPYWFDYMWVSKKKEILKEYAGTCPDSIYVKYGKTSDERIKNIDKFIVSKDFNECIRRYGGQVASKGGLKINEKNYKKIKDQKIRKNLLKLNNKIKKKLKKTDYVALITKTNINKEKKEIMKHILRHEWIHILLEKNKIYFQKINNKYWPYDEGLVTYLDAFLENQVTRLKIKIDKEKHPMERKYYIYAIKFRKLFKDEKNPGQRKKIILNLIKKLNKGK